MSFVQLAFERQKKKAKKERREEFKRDTREFNAAGFRRSSFVPRVNEGAWLLNVHGRE